MADSVPFIDFSASTVGVRSDLIEAVTRVIDSGHLIMGPEVSAFEGEFATFCGAGHSVGVSSGLEALSLTLRAAGIGPGDEVIVPSQTFIASWLAVSHVGATPVPVDVDATTCTLSPDAIEAALSPHTRAIMPVHLFGHPADMASIMDIAASRDLFVLEDAAQAHGATFQGRKIGSLGHAAAFSFYPTKNLGAFGDAGAVTTNDGALADRLRSLRNYGSPRKYQHDEIGFNARLDEIQAALLRVRLQHLDADNVRRREAATRYNTLLSKVPGLQLPSEAPWATHVYHLYVIQLDRRDALAQYLRENGVSTLVHYPSAPGDTTAYAELPQRQPRSVGKALAERSLSLPLWPAIASEQIDRTANLISEFVASNDV